MERFRVRPGAGLRPTALALILCAGLTLSFSFCHGGDKLKPAKTAEARRGDLVLTVSAPGRIVPSRRTTIKSKAAGEIMDIVVKEGDTVSEGAVLMRLDPEVEQARLEQARADHAASLAAVRQAELELAQQRSDLSSARVLFKEGFLSREDYERKQRELQISGNGLEIAKSRELSSRHGLAEAADRLSYTEIRAPMDGVVLDLGVSRGQVVSSGISGLDTGTPLLTLADLSRLRVTADVEETDVARVRPGQEARVEVDAFPDEVFSGRISQVSPEAVKKGAVTIIEVEVELDEGAERLRPGMSATVEIVTGRFDDVLLVPVSAVLSRGGEQGAVAMEDGATTWRPLELGPGDWETVVVRSGLTAGDLVLLPAGP